MSRRWSENAIVESDNLAERLLTSRKGGRSVYQGRKVGAGVERREEAERKDDGKSQRSHAGSGSTVTWESVKVYDRSGEACCSTKIVGGQGALEVRPSLFRRLIVLRKRNLRYSTLVRTKDWYMLRLLKQAVK